MNALQIQQQENDLKRILLLYGQYSMLNMVSCLSGYYLLPEVSMLDSPFSAISSFVATGTSFWGEFGLVRRALGGGDATSAARSASGLLSFQIFLLINRIYACPTVINTNRWDVDSMYIAKGKKHVHF